MCIYITLVLHGYAAANTSSCRYLPEGRAGTTAVVEGLWAAGGVGLVVATTLQTIANKSSMLCPVLIEYVL